MNATFATLVLLVTIVSAAILNKKYDAKQYLNKYEEFSCGDPQPRSVVVHNDTNPNIMFEPPMTVLHRCSGSGCCLQGVCSPLTEEDVQIVFLQIIFLPQIQTYKKQSLRRYVTEITETVKNHTRCYCRLD